MYTYGLRANVWDADELSIGYLWDAHGLPMRYPWDALEMPLECPRDVNGMPMGSSPIKTWVIHGLPMGLPIGCPRGIHGLPLEPHWLPSPSATHWLRAACSWNAHGLSFSYIPVWDAYGTRNA